MPTFKEQLKLNNQTAEFSFTRIKTPDQQKFFVTSVDPQKNNISFDMVLNHDGKWNIVQPAPEFILQIKEHLVNLIKKHS